MSAMEARRRLGLLIETVESECEPDPWECHGHDLTDDGKCALLTDLQGIHSELDKELRA